MFNIPSSKGLFDPDSVGFQKTDLQITPDLVENIKAMADPQGTLLEHQRKQAASTIAGVKLDNLRPDMQKRVMDDMQDYLEKYQGKMAKNSGLARLKLNFADEIEMKNERYNFQNRVNHLESINKKLDPAIHEAISTLEPGEAKKWLNDWEQHTKDVLADPKKDLGDIKDPTQDLLNYQLKHPKLVKPEDIIKKEKEYYDFINEGQTGEYTDTDGKKQQGFDKEKAYRNIMSTPGADKWDTDEIKKRMQRSEDHWKNPDKGINEYQKQRLSQSWYEFNQREKDKEETKKDKEDATKVDPDFDDSGKKYWDVSGKSYPWKGSINVAKEDADKNKINENISASGSVVHVYEKDGKMYQLVNITYNDKDENDKVVTKSDQIEVPVTGINREKYRKTLKGWDEKTAAAQSGVKKTTIGDPVEFLKHNVTKQLHKDNPFE